MGMINVGIQLYSVREEIEKYGLDTVLGVIRDAGFDSVEFAGFYGLTPTEMKAKLAGDDEAMEIDESFLGAMEAGMPPMSGLGMGIDRLLQLFTEQENIKDCILVPLMRPLDD